MRAAELALLSRAQGLRTHLLSREGLESLARSPDVASLARALSQAGLASAGEAPGAAAVEQAVRRTHARALATLRRFVQHPPGVLDVFFAVQERRALRALLRGAFQGAPAEARLRGAMPTPKLPERALSELSHQPTPGSVAALLLVLGHPDATRLLQVTQGAEPVLFDVELALLEGFAARAVADAQRVDGVLRAYVATRLDVGNAQNALLLAEGPRDVEAAHAFVPGGRWLSREAFVGAAQSTSRAAGYEAVRAALARTPLADVFRVGAEGAAAVDRALLEHTLTWLLHLQRAQPLSSASTLRLLVRLEAQAHDVRAVTFGVQTGAPVALLRKELVTPWS